MHAPQRPSTTPGHNSTTPGLNSTTPGHNNTLTTGTLGDYSTTPGHNNSPGHNSSNNTTTPGRTLVQEYRLCRTVEITNDCVLVNKTAYPKDDTCCYNYSNTQVAHYLLHRALPHAQYIARSALIKPVAFQDRKLIDSLLHTQNTPGYTIRARSDCCTGPLALTDLVPPAYKIFVQGSQSKPVHQKQKKDPIILVPAAAQALLSLSNIKAFLQDSIYTPATQQKPQKVVFTHLKRTFTVLDSPDALSPKDWDRVIVVFTSGQEWQFKNYKYPLPVDLFSRVMGVCCKFVDENPPGSAASWNLEFLNVLFL